MCGNSKENGVIIHYGHQGVERIDSVELTNNILKIRELVPQRQVEKYTEFDFCSPLEFYYINDFSPLLNYSNTNGQNSQSLSFNSQFNDTDIDLILNRKLFVFQNDFPQLYSTLLDTANITSSYFSNVTLREVLNDAHFYGIEWKNTKTTDMAKIIKFNGTSRISDVFVEIDFVIQQGAKFPIASVMNATGSSEKSSISFQKYVDNGLDGDSAIISADASISVMLAKLANT